MILKTYQNNHHIIIKIFYLIRNKEYLYKEFHNNPNDKIL